MAHLSFDPRLDLYDAAQNTFTRISRELQGAEGLRYIGFLESTVRKQEFSDPASTFEADEYTLDGIERFDEHIYALAVDLYKDGEPYIRRTDLTLPDVVANSEDRKKHLIALTQDGPPVLLHNLYFSSLFSSASDLHFLLAADRGEVLGISRSQSVVQTLGSLAAEQVDPEYFI